MLSWTTVNMQRKTVGRIGILWNKVTPTRGAGKVTSYLQGISNATKEIRHTVFIQSDRLAVSIGDARKSGSYEAQSCKTVPESRYYARCLQRAGIREIEIPQCLSAREIKRIFDTLIGANLSRAAEMLEPMGVHFRIEHKQETMCDGLLYFIQRDSPHKEYLYIAKGWALEFRMYKGMATLERLRNIKAILDRHNRISFDELYSRIGKMAFPGRCVESYCSPPMGDKLYGQPLPGRFSRSNDFEEIDDGNYRSYYRRKLIRIGLEVRRGSNQKRTLTVEREQIARTNNDTGEVNSFGLERSGGETGKENSGARGVEGKSDSGHQFGAVAVGPVVAASLTDSSIDDSWHPMDLDGAVWGHYVDGALVECTDPAKAGYDPAFFAKHGSSDVADAAVADRGQGVPASSASVQGEREDVYDFHFAGVDHRAEGRSEAGDVASSGSEASASSDGEAASSSSSGGGDNVGGCWGGGGSEDSYAGGASSDVSEGGNGGGEGGKGD